MLAWIFLVNLLTGGAHYRGKVGIFAAGDESAFGLGLDAIQKFAEEGVLDFHALNDCTATSRSHPSNFAGLSAERMILLRSR